MLLSPVQAVELVSLPEYSPEKAAPAWDQLRDNRDFQTMVAFHPTHRDPTPEQILTNFQVKKCLMTRRNLCTPTAPQRVAWIRTF